MHRVLAVLQPAPAAVPQVSKRGGKIVLVKKKGARAAAGPLAVPSVPLAIRPGLVTPGGLGEPSPEAQERLRKKRRRRKTFWISTVSVLGGGAAIAGAVWAVLRYNAGQEQRATEARERALLEGYRREAETVWSASAAAASNAAQRLAKALPILADVDTLKTRIDAAVTIVPGDVMNAGASTNAEAQARLAAEAVTGALQAALADLAALTNDVATNRNALLLSTPAVQALSLYGAITGAAPRADALDQTAAAAFARAQAAYKSLQAMDKKLAAAVEAKLAGDEKLAAAKAEEEKLAREQAEKERLAREHADLAQNEIKRIEDKRKENAPLIQQNKYKEAEDAVAALQAGLTTDEAKAVCKMALERYRVLEDLKKFVIAGIQADAKNSPDGFKFGWISPSRDVLNADENKVAIRGGTVPWDQVSPMQLLTFVKHYVASPDLGPREASAQRLAGAVYFAEASGGNEKAQKSPAGVLAAALLSDALRLSPSLEEQAKRLLPDLGGKSP